MDKHKIYPVFLGIILIILLAGSFFIGSIAMSVGSHDRAMEDMNIDQHRMAFLQHKDAIIQDLIHKGDYACCLKKPCMYCIEKTPGHGEGAACRCLDDIMNGRHPCGECIGEILEGHGNPYIAKYFATAIAQEVGERHLDALKEIIESKYNVPMQEQI